MVLWYGGMVWYHTNRPMRMLAAFLLLLFLLGIEAELLDKIVAIQLSGAVQVPSVDSSANGIMTLTYNDVLDAIIWAMDIDNPDSLGVFGTAGAHIHCGSSGFTGPILVELQAGVPNNTTEIGLVGIILEEDILPGGCFATIENLWTAMTTSFGVYVNVHSEENPSGEIRGDFLGGGIAAEAEYLTGVMTGAAVAPNPVATNVTGDVIFLYSRYLETLVFSLEIDNPDQVDIFGGSSRGISLFCGSEGITGEEIASLVSGESPVSGMFIGAAGTVVDVVPGGCVATLPNLWNDMTRFGIYISVSSDANPDGEIRADLGRVPTASPTAMPSTDSTAAPSSNPVPPTGSATDMPSTDMPSTETPSSKKPFSTETPTRSPVTSTDVPATFSPSSGGTVKRLSVLVPLFTLLSHLGMILS